MFVSVRVKGFIFLLKFCQFFMVLITFYPLLMSIYFLSCLLSISEGMCSMCYFIFFSLCLIVIVMFVLPLYIMFGLLFPLSLNNYVCAFCVLFLSDICFPFVPLFYFFKFRKVTYWFIFLPFLCVYGRGICCLFSTSSH